MIMQVSQTGPIFTPAECDSIVNPRLGGDWTEGEVYRTSTDVETVVMPSVRKVTVQPIDRDASTEWIFERIEAEVAAVNAATYSFDITGEVDLRLLCYTVDDHFGMHVDTGGEVGTLRKLSIVVQLTDPANYEGGTLVLPFQQTEASKDQGNVTMFPSFCPHKVRPVTSGTRYCLVAWARGTVPFR